jgi:L-ascorbate metabolism protein UlaG (beta-lactamase superfamily)
VEEGPARLLLDPGTLPGGFEELEGLTAVLVTHQHGDHLDLQRLRTLLDRYRQFEQLGGATLRLLDDGAPVEL